jgi:Flp pilus assembly protein protease CpaA
MLSNSNFIGYGVLISILTIAGVQDWQRGEVSNWISIPLFVLGVIAFILRAILMDDLLVSTLHLFVMSVITLAALKGWMGGADWKVLIALFGMWPLAGVASLVVAGLWGVIAIVFKCDRNTRFPGVTAFAFAACLTYFIQLSIILFE